MLLTIWVSIIFLTLMGLGAFTFARNTKSAVNRNFAIFTTILAIWVVANFIGANFKTSSMAPLFAHIDFLFGPWLGFSFWLFTDALLTQAVGKDGRQRLAITFLSLAVVASLLTLAGLVVTITASQSAFNVNYGSFFIIYAAIVVVLAAKGIINMIVALHKSRGMLRIQLNIMIWGVIFAAIALTLANIIVPQLTSEGSTNLIAGNLSYLGPIAFIGLVTYAIVRHRLFDIRLIVARSIAYTLVIILLVSLYTGLAILFSLLLPAGRSIVLEERILYIVAAIVAAFAFAPTKKFFDRWTDRLFYQDAYNAQVFFNDFNQVLVSTADLEKMLQKALQIVENNLKTEYALIILRPSGASNSFRIIGTIGKAFKQSDLLAPRTKEALGHYRETVIAADYLEAGEERLQHILRKNNISILARVGDGPDAHSHLGHIILGPKKSGNPYNDQDIHVMEAVANELAIAIQNALRFEEIEKFNATLQQKIEDATYKLRRTNEKLRQLDQTKDDFISMASHQLRTPLTSVKGYVSMVLDGDAGPVSPLQRKLLNQSYISSQRMVYLISDLLNVSRLRTGKFVIEAMPSNLAKVIDEEIDQLQETAKGRNLELTYQKPHNFPTLMLDETKIRQVIMNFIDNAIYYTPSGGHISVNLLDKPDTVEFTVADDGIGVSKHEQMHLFTKFFRAHNAKRARPDGTGLGLFMAKKVIVAQGGAIIFKSKEGKGSTFGFTFAKSKLQQPAPANAHSEDSKKK